MIVKITGKSKSAKASLRYVAPYNNKAHKNSNGVTKRDYATFGIGCYNNGALATEDFEDLAKIGRKHKYQTFNVVLSARPTDFNLSNSNDLERFKQFSMNYAKDAFNGHLVFGAIQQDNINKIPHCHLIVSNNDNHGKSISTNHTFTDKNGVIHNINMTDIGYLRHVKDHHVEVFNYQHPNHKIYDIDKNWHSSKVDKSQVEKIKLRNIIKQELHHQPILKISDLKLPKNYSLNYPKKKNGLYINHKYENGTHSWFKLSHLGISFNNPKYKDNILNNLSNNSQKLLYYKSNAITDDKLNQQREKSNQKRANAIFIKKAKNDANNLGGVIRGVFSGKISSKTDFRHQCREHGFAASFSRQNRTLTFKKIINGKPTGISFTASDLGLGDSKHPITYNKVVSTIKHNYGQRNFGFKKENLYKHEKGQILSADGMLNDGLSHESYQPIKHKIIPVLMPLNKHLIKPTSDMDEDERMKYQEIKDNMNAEEQKHLENYQDTVTEIKQENSDIDAENQDLRNEVKANNEQIEEDNNEQKKMIIKQRRGLSR